MPNVLEQFMVEEDPATYAKSIASRLDIILRLSRDLEKHNKGNIAALAHAIFKQAEWISAELSGAFHFAEEIGERRGRGASADYVASVAEKYPVEVFPVDGKSVDCHSARVMRHASKWISEDLRTMIVGRKA